MTDLRQGVGRLPRGVEPDVGEYQLGARSCEAKRDREPDATGPARDERDAVAKGESVAAGGQALLI